ncbi:MAG TPA: glycosyltransferase family 4 protein [Anaerolineales bacterium]|nr:glycosyltransferase family 4 protein [Anaerolineales bacterium]
MRILIIGTMYEPDLGPSAPLFSSLCRELVRSGHEVTVITTVPHYPTGRVAAAFQGRLIWRSIEDGVNVIRISVPSVDRSKLSLRLLQYVSYQLGAAWVVMTGPRYDVVLAGSTSLTVLLPFVASVVVRRIPAIYSVQDLYPNVGITLGIFRNKLVIDIVAALEKFIFKNSKIVQIISESFRQSLQDLGVPDSKVKLVYNWVDTEFIRPMPRLNEFSKEYGLDERFVILYSGNMGPSQGLENILRAAERLKNEKDIIFVLIGDGLNKEFLVNEAKKRSLSNLLFLPFQPRERFPYALASADISLVPLRRGIDQGSLPSKLFTVLASGRPVIVCVEEESEIWRLVKLADAGRQVPTDDPAALSNAILALRNDIKLREQLGCNGRLWAEQNHSILIAEEKFEKLFLSAIQKRAKL